ncbi:hypothetical protein PSHT_04992 [Puccinia striiformis]|uniref:Phosphatidate cytidylyltransferase, mitochondrial n=1 Tax=Puccinia striiformis TaxID=27350 RepID=A0A2S4WBP3_9BASI|nr:hypothetical protein PSHT_04992 [Puccinia striiformis]
MVNSVLRRTISTKIKLPPQFARNQLLPVRSTTLSNELNGILNTFKPPIRYALAYGSGVFPQKSYTYLQDQPTPMLDFIFAVSHPNHWHSMNLHHNPTHYSIPARLVGSDSVAWLQENGPGAGVWFNVQAKINDRVIKYGVVSIDSLCNDLLDWNTLYLSGRMHKPTHILRDDPRVRLAQQVNLASAIRVSLLLPETFNEESLYQTITGLSYTGDFRMNWGGENPKKVENIVERQIELFRILYRPLIYSLKSHLIFNPLDNSSSASTTYEKGVFVQDYSPQSRAKLLQKLPIQLKERIRTNELEILTKITTDNGRFQESLRSALIAISIRYAANKVLKRFTASS